MSTSPPTARSERAPSLLLSLVPVVALVALLVLNVRVFGSQDSQISLILATSIAALIAVVGLRQPWQRIEEGMTKAIGLALQAMMILLVVGMLIAAWIQAGVVPLLIVYGLELVAPSAFLVTACIVCCVVSLACGSSWTTAGTVGVALMGIGQTLGLEPGLVGGAVVSGAYFGDKMSPLSDTTNLAPAMAGSTLFEHVKHMIWTVTPALVIALGLYALLGGRVESSPDSFARVSAVVETLHANFELSPWLLASPLLVLGLVVRKFPALPALMIGTLSAVALGLVLQPSGEGFVKDLGDGFALLYGGYALDFHSPAAAGLDPSALESAKATVTELLHERGGMKSMLGTVGLIVCALSFGGVMERSGMLGVIAASILKLVRGTGSLLAATIVTCFGVNVLASDQYMAIVVPGRMFKRAFIDRRLHPKNLSRALEDSGTVTSALVPWNTCGAQMTAVLGVATVAYAPYAFLNWICPIVSIVYGFTGFTITKLSEEEARRFSEVEG